jgi:hypothetical protein
MNDILVYYTHNIFFYCTGGYLGHNRSVVDSGILDVGMIMHVFLYGQETCNLYTTLLLPRGLLACD